MTTIDAVSTSWVWEKMDADLANAIVAFWLREGALRNEEKARARLPQVTMVAWDNRDKEKNIVAVASMEIKHSPILENNFCFCRQFVTASLRQSGLATRIGVEVYNFLEAEFLKGKLDAKGLILEFENEFLNAELKSAVLNHLPFVYFGHNTKGQQMRVCYFKGAKVLDF